MSMRSPLLLFVLGLSFATASCGSLPLIQRKARNKSSLAPAHEVVLWCQLEAPALRHPEPAPLPDAADSKSTLALGPREAPSHVGLFLGIGEAPYDDGLPPNDLHFREATGFSDSLVHVSYEAPLVSRVRWFSQVSATRFQSQTLMETLEEGDFAWVTLGLRFAW